MGREIRRVPLGWEHPTFQLRTLRGRLETRFQPKRKVPYATMLSEWQEERDRWDNGQDPDRKDRPNMSYEEWGGPPPDPSFHMPVFEEPCEDLKERLRSLGVSWSTSFYKAGEGNSFEVIQTSGFRS